MCGRFTLKTPAPMIAELLGLEPPGPRQLELFAPRYNIAPTQDVAVVRTATGGGREAVGMRWGLIPSWSKELPKSAPLINARSESLTEKPTFRGPLKRTRCLIPADGFYEWTTEGKRKQPHYIRFPDGRLYAFAGLWDRWRGPGGAGPVIESCTILTTAANAQLAPLHDRMPVILAPGDYDLWLDGAVENADDLRHLFDPLPAGELAIDPVDPRVNKVANDDPQCVTVQRSLF
ncbi:MAG: SOS response-associated peptidase [Planctomycetales bacterium]|nr:SOS response-associated peptidase [Planctomycetales bacterium]